MDLKLPNLGEGADSGTVVNLFVKEGDALAKDQPVLELENEKAVATIPSTLSGQITKIYVKAGEKISVGQRILAVSDGSASPAESPRAEATPVRQAAVSRPEPQPEEPRDYKQEPEVYEAAPEPIPGVPLAAAPSLRKMARDLGIDLTKVRGSGRGGRILIEDVRAYIQRLQRAATQPRPAGATAAPAAPSPASAPKPAAEPVNFAKWGPVSRKPLSPLRQVIARRMLQNWNTVPHVTQFDEADITDLMALRKKYAEAYEKRGARLTLTSFALKIVVNTLKKHPALNSSLDESSQDLIQKEFFHIGIAVDTEAGLIVPVIRDVDKKDLVQLSKELEELAGKARDRKVSAEELKGGTFTISNQGGIGGAHFTPIINKPEVAILGLGRGALKPQVRAGAIEPRMTLPIVLSYDHRVIDGGSAARFTVDLVKAFENFREEDVKI